MAGAVVVGCVPCCEPDCSGFLVAVLVGSHEQESPSVVLAFGDEVVEVGACVFLGAVLLSVCEDDDELVLGGFLVLFSVSDVFVDVVYESSCCV